MKPLTQRESRGSKKESEYGLRDLMLAVLEDALGTFQEGLLSPVPAKRVEAFKVEAWVASDDVDWPFAFVNVCNAVGVTPQYVRACLLRWRRKAIREEGWAN